MEPYFADPFDADAAFAVEKLVAAVAVVAIVAAWD